MRRLGSGEETGRHSNWPSYSCQDECVSIRILYYTSIYTWVISRHKVAANGKRILPENMLDNIGCWQQHKATEADTNPQVCAEEMSIIRDSLQTCKLYSCNMTTGDHGPVHALAVNKSVLYMRVPWVIAGPAL